MAFDHSACPHCRRLREERDDLIEQVLDLKEKLYGDCSMLPPASVPKCLGLSRQRSGILDALIRLEIATKHVLQATCQDYSRIGFEHTSNHVAVQVSFIRTALKPYGVCVENVHGVGYMIAPDGKRIIAELLAKERATEAAQIPQPTKEEVTL